MAPRHRKRLKQPNYARRIQAAQEVKPEDSVPVGHEVDTTRLRRRIVGRDLTCEITAFCIGSCPSNYLNLHCQCINIILYF